MECLLSSAVFWIFWLVFGLLAYWYVSRDRGYWKSKGIPCVPPPVPIVGRLLSFSKLLQEEDLKTYRKYGRLHGQYAGSQPILIVADPHLLRDILVKDFHCFTNRRTFSVGEPVTSKMLAALKGEDWKRVRSLVTPAFTTGKLKRMLSIFKDCARTLSNNFRAAAKKGQAVNAKGLFGAFTMDVIASSAFSTRLDSHNDPTNEFAVVAHSAFNVKYPWKNLLFFLFPGFMRFFKIRVFAPEAILFFRDVALQIIEERKKTGQTRNDFLQLLLDVAKEVGEEDKAKEDKEDMTSNYGSESDADIFKQYRKNKSLTYEELVAQCVVFFLAGYETTASALSFASYNLALNPDCQERLIEEIDRSLQDSGGEITYEAIQNMKYLDNVISETLRLFPPLTRLDRIADEDYKLGDTGITIPKGMVVGIPVYAMQRDPEFFPDPEKFDPDRFTSAEKARRNPYTYMPFGVGPRNCIGMRFALLEIKVCLAYVYGHFRVRRCSETQVPLRFANSGNGLVQPKEIKLQFQPLHEEDVIRHKKYGRLFGYYEGSRPALTVAEPELVRDILVKDFQFFTGRRKTMMSEAISSKMVVALEGEDWKRVRSIITPAFTTGKIKRMLGIFKDCARTLSDNCRAAAKKGKPVHPKVMFGAFSMDVIASSAFSTKIDSHNDPNNKFVAVAKTTFNAKIPWRLVFFFLFPDLCKFFKISIFVPSALRFFRDVTLQIIEERKRTGQTRNDFLQLLLDVAKEVGEEEDRNAEVVKEEHKDDITSNYGTDGGDDFFKQYFKNKSLSRDELVAQCVIFFLAGYETTATTLSFASYSLAVNPQVQETLIQEIDREVKEAGGIITYEAIHNMKYLDNVISETLRLYPPSVRVERVADEDYKLGETGITVPKGMLIGIPSYAMHHDPEFFPDPEKFDPDRFTPEQKSRRDPYTYLPFGAGPRNCLGMRFALMETKVGLAYILSHFRVRRCPETQVPLQFRIAQAVLKPKELQVLFEVRQDAVLKE